MHAQDSIVAARHERAAAEEGDVLRWRVAAEGADEPQGVVVVDRELAAVARRHPDVRPVGLVADVVRQERWPDPVDNAGPSGMVEADDRDLGALASKDDPEPPAEHVERQMARRATDRNPSHDSPGA